MARENIVRITLYTLALFLFLQTNSTAQLIEATDPTVSHIEMVRGSGDPDYTGALNFEIPLMKIPGRGGLDYDLKLQYVHGNGVPAAESSSWVGLGWNLNLYQVSCSPVYWSKGYCYDQVYSDAKDRYIVSYPGGSTAVYKFAGGWLPLDWCGIKIETIQDTQLPDNWGVQQDYLGFIVTDLDGTRYIYADRLRQESALPLRNHCNNQGQQPHGHTLDKHAYYYVFKLSAITGPDYVDGDGATDPMDRPGTGGTDTGSWIRLQYSTPTEVVSGIFGTIYRMEVNHLLSISTPTNTAYFTVAMPPSTGNYFIYQGYTSSLQQVGRLQSIALAPNGIIVNFDNDSRPFSWARPVPGEDFCTLVKQGSGTGYDFLRTRLNGISINQGASIPSYKFRYYPGPTKAHGDICGVDPWGYYTDNPDLLHPTEQESEAWRAWMLRSVVYPTGDSVLFEYESNRYQTHHGDFRGSDGDGEVIAGGMRLKRQSITNVHTGVISVYEYEYALTNERHPNYGFLSCEPMIFDPTPWDILPVRNAVAANLRTEVHYPDVQITRPDGSRIRKYYTSAVSGVYTDAHVPSTCQVTQPLQYTYWRSYWSTTTVPDPVIQSYNLIGSNLYQFFDPYTDHEYYLLEYYPSEAYNNPTDAFRGEAKEFDDCTPWIQMCKFQAFILQIFDNSWKRGRLTCEELYLPIGEEAGAESYCDPPLERKLYYYTMAPVTTESYNIYTFECAGQGCPDQYHWYPCFVTSGWARLDKVETYTRQRTGVPYLELTRREEYEYNTTSGLVSKETVRAGQNPEALSPRVTSIYYEHERETNSTMHNLHMWSQKKLVVIGGANSTFSATPTANLDVSSLTQTLWRNDQGRWVPDKTLQWLDADGDQDVDAGEIPVVQDFVSYDEHGNPKVIKDAKLTTTTVLWGYSGSVPIAKCVGCNSEEFGFNGLEDQHYDGWWNEMPVELADLFTGSWSAYVGLFNGHEFGPSKDFSQSAGLRADVGYKASAWVKSASPARLYICINNNSYYHYDESSGSNEWELLEVELPKSEVLAGMNGDDFIRIFCYNNSDEDAYFDDIRFYRADALVTSWTYDPRTMLVASVSDASNVTRRYFYDPYGRLSVESDGGWNNLMEYTYTYSRIMNQNGNYDPSNPNSIKTVAYGRQGLWHNFEYTDSPSSHCWYVASGSGTVSTVFDATLQSRVMRTPTTSPPTNFDIRFPNPNGCYPYNSGTLDIPNPYLTVKIKDTNTFTFNVRVRSTNQSEYYLVYTPEVGTPYVSGQNIYYYLGTEYRSGQWKTIERDLRKDFSITGLEFESVRWFLIEGDYDLDDLRLNDQSITTVAYFDGGGREIQTQTWLGDKDIIAVKEYNDIGEVERAYHPQIVPDAYHRYYPSLTPFTLYETFDYHHEPLARLKTQQHPDGTTIQCGFGFLSSTPATGRFESVIDENGYFSQRVFDHEDRPIFENLADGTTDEIQWKQEYDVLGNLKRIMPPNYFDPPHGTATQWDIENSYDTMGRLTQKLTPDEGTTKYVYDLNGNVIYSQTAHQFDNESNDYCFTVYEYDAQNRVKKIAEETSSDWNGGSAPPAGSYSTNPGEWKVRFTYDVNQVAGATNYCQGKLTMVEINNNTDDAVEHTFRYLYDRFGRLAAKYIRLDGGSPLTEKVIRYEYDRLGRLTTLVYPTGHRLMRIYDDAGRLKKIYNLQ